MTRLGMPEDVKPFGQTLNLDIVRFIATLIALGRIGGYVGETGDFTIRHQSSLRTNHFKFNEAKLGKPGFMISSILAECRKTHSVLRQTVQIDVAANHLRRC